ncbi:hypothetical protein CEXT_632461 [Caerostris extrusa]|uniref:Uncharacterized protein n=1 Tax=Caerostris extrusa TaxID=172846 RepID=A0AAV4RUA5_CAEEX|nr:hypothetical protein CEXT_632461 [Caerostris extrusa]
MSWVMRLALVSFTICPKRSLTKWTPSWLPGRRSRCWTPGSSQLVHAEALETKGIQAIRKEVKKVKFRTQMHDQYTKTIKLRNIYDPEDHTTI